MREKSDIGRAVDRTQRLSEGPQTFTLAEQVERLREESEYKELGKSSIILARKSHLRVVLSVLAAGKEMETHHTAGPYALQVLEGELQVNWGQDQSLVVSQGDLLTFPGETEHSFVAVEDCAFLLILYQPTEATVEISPQ